VRAASEFKDVCANTSSRDFENNLLEVDLGEYGYLYCL
jgi:hypothetical protein